MLSTFKTRTKAKDQEDVKGRCFLAGGCSPTEQLRTWLPFLATASTPSSSSCPACPRPASRGGLGVEVLFRADRRKSWCARAGTAPTPPLLGESITFPHLGLRAMHLCPLQHIWLKVGQQGLFGAHVMKRAQMTELTMEEAERGKEADKAPLTPGEGGVRWQDWVTGGIS